MNAKNLNAFANLALAAALFLCGCKTTRDQAPRKSWATQSTEQVGLVPSLPLLGQSPLATPTQATGQTKSMPWGLPKNLTQPIPGKKTKTQTHATKGNSQSGTVGKAGSPVIVNVHQTKEAAETASSPSEKESASRLETLYGGRFERTADRNLEQFGYAYFSGVDKVAQNAGPVSNDYIVGPNDEIVLALSGSTDAYHRITVDRDGFLQIPDFGPIPVAGLYFGELKDVILTFLKERLTGFELTVSMGRLRSIRVSVIGQVNRPGIVEISSLSSPVAAIIAAGGPLKTGSLRQISLRQADSSNDASVNIDLYNLLRNPDDAPSYPTLRDGDTIHIPSIGPTIGIAGYIQQPGIYELSRDSIEVTEALELAGGLTPFSFTPLAHIERTVDGRGRQKIGVELDADGLSQAMSDGELLLIEAVDGKRQPIVRIEGEVSRPGDYEFRPGMTLSELIERADGLTIDAYLPQAFVSRQLGIAEVIQDVPQRAAHSRTRRVIVSDLSKAVSKNPFHNIKLMPLDLVTIRSHKDARPLPTVEIIGSVQHPGRYELTAGMRVSDLVAIAGNPTPDVYYDEAELIRRVFDEKTRRLDAQRYRLDLRQALNTREDRSNPHDTLLANGDQLVIRSLQQAQVRVRIEGQVRFPGEYVFPSGAKISDLVAAADGILEDANLRAAIFTRESTKQLQKQRLEHLEERTRRLFEKALEKMVQTGHAREGIAAQLSLTQTMGTVDRIQRDEADGRIVLPFDRPDFPDSEYNLPLETGDRLYVPKRHATVSVAGHVFRPISLVAAEPISIKQALEQAGGLTENAAENQLYVIRADGAVSSIAQKASRLRKSDPLLPGDVLLVPRKATERAFGAKLSDTLALARQAAELGLISAGIGKDIDFTLVQPNDTRKGAANPDIFLDQIK